MRTVETILAATWGLLASAAAREPVLLVVDDIQWLDAASRDALSFALRRLDGRIGALVSVRSDADDQASRLCRTFGPQWRISRATWDRCRRTRRHA